MKFVPKIAVGAAVTLALSLLVAGSASADRVPLPRPTGPHPIAIATYTPQPRPTAQPSSTSTRPPAPRPTTSPLPSTCPTPTKPPVRVLVHGDSITQGQPPTDWPTLLGQYLAKMCIPVEMHNAAVSGWGTQQVIDTLPGLMQQYHPDWVMLAIGTNDAPDIAAFENRYATMLQIVRDQGGPAVKIFPGYLQCSDRDRLASNLQWVRDSEPGKNNAISRRTWTNGSLAPQIGSVIKNDTIPPNYLKADGLHPVDPQGFDQYARQALSALSAGGVIPPPPAAYRPDATGSCWS